MDTLQLLKSSQTNEWYTPIEHITLVRKVLGIIDLDPASSIEANAFVKATNIYTMEDDSNSYDEYLTTPTALPWCGHIYCNPPYGGLAGKFAKKAQQEYDSGRMTDGILCLSGYAYETKWFRPILRDLSIPICWVYGRVKFSRYVNNMKNLENKASTVGTMYVYLGANSAMFTKVFATIGAIR